MFICFTFRHYRRVMDSSNVICLILITFPFLVHNALSAKDKSLYCGACKAIINELEYSIDKIDPKKKIDVGGYRIDSKGKSKTVQISYARSESHLTQLLETVCNDLSDNYVVSKHPKTGKKMLKRMVTHDGKMSTDIDFNQLMQDTQNQNPDTPPDAKSNKVKFACESLVEEFEDDIVEQFADEESGDPHKICLEMSNYCDSDEKDEL